ncbi:hypothetical protein PCASD_08777 [Puccinia coronata f. sp. avenae]|uniref:DUF6589 domain-containing protein n=1 Tax=Puccinia coronata f. sp. avenae TaxID=200324 RepID=A0A2N5UPE0_9BASI|nr:hypothetical protein PCASD_08777 [Puccinia coronata f. sp. avenae]
MPFLYELISSKLLNGIKSKSEDGKHPDCDSDNADSTASDNSSSECDLLTDSKDSLSALDRVGHQAQKNLAGKIFVHARKPLSPLICIDNLDFEERVQFKSIEKTSHMFHGTWGYVHTINPHLLQSADPNDFSMKTLQKATKDLENMEISPTMFLPTCEQEVHFTAAIESQIAQAMMTYVAETDDPKSSIPLKPPPIDLITPKKPDIALFKLMLASDNCASGIREILNNIIRQTNLTPNQFFSELQIMEGNLAMVQNLKCLQSQRKPSGHKEDALANIFMNRGASHTLWNIGQAVYLKHYGDNKKQDNLAAQHLQRPKASTRHIFSTSLHDYATLPQSSKLTVQ